MQLAVKRIGFIITQRALAYSTEWKCTKSGKVNGLLNVCETVISTC